jgi:hypothetical protein
MITTTPAHVQLYLCVCMLRVASLAAADILSQYIGSSVLLLVTALART